MGSVSPTGQARKQASPPVHGCVGPGSHPRGRGHWTRLACLVILLTMSELMPLAVVKSHLSELVGRVQREHERVTVTVHGRPSVVLLALDDLEALEETIAVLSDSEALRQLAASDAELARGEGEGLDALNEAMRRRQAHS